MKILLTSLCVTIAICMAGLSPAATLAEYNVVGANAGLSGTVGLAHVEPNVSASVLSPNGALGLGWNSPSSFCYDSWPTGAIDPSKYYEFAVTPAPGYEIVLTDMVLSLASGPPGTGTFEVHASTDGFVSSDVLIAVQNFPNDGTWHKFTLNLSTLGVQQGAVTFRFYMYNVPAFGFSGLGADPNFGPEGGNLFVNGTVRLSTVPVAEASWSRIKSLYSDR